MRLTHLQFDFEHDGKTHQAIFCYTKPRACGIRENVNTDNPWFTLLNATPEEVVRELQQKYGLTPDTTLLLRPVPREKPRKLDPNEQPEERVQKGVHVQ